MRDPPSAPSARLRVLENFDSRDEMLGGGLPGRPGRLLAFVGYGRNEKRDAAPLVPVSVDTYVAGFSRFRRGYLPYTCCVRLFATLRRSVKRSLRNSRLALDDRRSSLRALPRDTRSPLFRGRGDLISRAEKVPREIRLRTTFAKAVASVLQSARLARRVRALIALSAGRILSPRA